MAYKSSRDTINKRLESRKIILVGEYSNAKSKTLFQCEYGHQWLASSHTVTNGKTGCPTCNTEIRMLSVEKVNKRLENKQIVMIGEYLGSLTKTKFQCQNNHVWEARPNNVLGNTGCPICSHSYFFRGDREAYEYIIQFENFIKYGITNNIDRRLSDHRKQGCFEVVHLKHHLNGNLAREWENRVRETFGGKFVSKEILPDGWTETLPIVLLEKIKII